MLNIAIGTFINSIPALNIAFTLSSLLVNSIFQLSPWSSKYIIPIALGNITTPEDHYRRNKLKQSILSKFGEIKYLINNSQYSSKLSHIERNLLPVLLLTYTKTNNYKKLSKLLELGANPDLSDYDDRTAMHIACRTGNIEIIKLLLKYKASTTKLDRYNHNCYYEAIINKKLYIFNEINNANIIAPPKELAWLFCNSVFKRDNIMIDLMIKLNIPVNNFDYDNRTPLHISVSNKYIDITKKLLNYNANPYIVDKFGNTPIDLSGGIDELNRLLTEKNESKEVHIDVGQMIEIKYKTDNNFNEDDKEVISLLCNELITMKENKIFQPYLLCALAAHGDLANIRKLDRLGINLLQKDYDDRTAIHLASSNNRIDVVNYLINHSTQDELSIKDTWGHSPLYDACINLNKDIVDRLIFHNAKLNLDNDQSIQLMAWALVSDEKELIELLIKSKISLDCYDYDNRSARSIAKEYDYNL